MRLFEVLPRFGYSRDLHRHLDGLSVDCQGRVPNSLYLIVSLSLLAICIIVMLNFYKGLFDNSRNTWRRSWLMNILFASLVSGGLAYFLAYKDLPDEAHCSEIHFTNLDCLLFGLTTMSYAVIVCLLLSLTFKWFSVSNKRIPF